MILPQASSLLCIAGIVAAHGWVKEINIDGSL